MIRVRILTFLVNNSGATAFCSFFFFASSRLVPKLSHRKRQKVSRGNDFRTFFFVGLPPPWSVKCFWASVSANFCTRTSWRFVVIYLRTAIIAKVLGQKSCPEVNTKSAEMSSQKFYGNSAQNMLNSQLAIRQEIQRFESVHPSIYAIYDLIELIPDPTLSQSIRDHVVCIEGKKQL